VDSNCEKEKAHLLKDAPELGKTEERRVREPAHAFGSVSEGAHPFQLGMASQYYIGIWLSLCGKSDICYRYHLRLFICGTLGYVNKEDAFARSLATPLMA
jgi:hypothetical protein